MDSIHKKNSDLYYGIAWPLESAIKLTNHHRVTKHNYPNSHVRLRRRCQHEINKISKFFGPTRVEQFSSVTLHFRCNCHQRNSQTRLLLNHVPLPRCPSFTFKVNEIKSNVCESPSADNIERDGLWNLTWDNGRMVHCERKNKFPRFSRTVTHNFLK